MHFFMRLLSETFLDASYVSLMAPAFGAGWSLRMWCRLGLHVGIFPISGSSSSKQRGVLRAGQGGVVAGKSFLSQLRFPFCLLMVDPHDSHHLVKAKMVISQPDSTRA